MRIATLAVAMLVLAAFTVRAQSRLGVPHALRAALTGCWRLGSDQTYVIESSGATGLRAHWQAMGEAGVVERGAENMYFRPDTQQIVAGCGATTQHGQLCTFALDDHGHVRVAMVSRFSGRATSLSATHCARGTTVRTTTPVAHPLAADAPIARWLAERRRNIDATHTPTGESDGWTQYADDVAIQFSYGVAMRVRAPIAASSCDEAAREAGFTPSARSSPLTLPDGCEWPGISARHRLAPRVAGRWTAGVFEIWAI